MSVTRITIITGSPKEKEPEEWEGGSKSDGTYFKMVAGEPEDARKGSVFLPMLLAFLETGEEFATILYPPGKDSPVAGKATASNYTSNAYRLPIRAYCRDCKLVLERTDL